MRFERFLVSRSVAALAALALCASVVSAGAGQMGDKRKETKIITSSVDVGGTKGAVEVRYLNVPWGEKTFSYLEVGGDDYYSGRTWPFAHLKLAKSATLGGKSLAPGDYVLYITPKSSSAPMSLTVASFKPGSSGTFLVEGNVFTETPSDASTILTVPVTFTKGEPVIDHLEIMVAKAASGAEIKVHYGDRWLSQTLEAK
jgi:hypothetical protein